ncbi:MAG: 50S ribosome-binding GTPase, partial [Spirochaetales bacterium]|nr:50S ribosome-binding GTPase [Spirochaetales bacterium]
MPKDRLPEIAFIGRSNVGKSSLINNLCNRKIAKTSSTP